MPVLGSSLAKPLALRVCSAAWARRQPTTHGGHSLVARGLYALQLAPWLEAFGDARADARARLLVLTNEELAADPQRTAARACAHVGLPPHPLDAHVAASRPNSRRYEPMDDATRAKLHAFYAPFNAKLEALLGRRLGW